MSEGLIMKYFILKPKGQDAYASASRAAMLRYADGIRDTNQTLADELRKWAKREKDAALLDASHNKKGGG